MIETVLVQLLTNDPAIGGAVGSRVYPLQGKSFKDDEFPFITYQRDSTARNYTLTGQSDPTSATMTMNIIGTDYTLQKELAENIRRRLSSASGEYQGMKVNWIRIDNELDSLVIPTDGAEFGLPTITMTLTAHFDEVKPNQGD